MPPDAPLPKQETPPPAKTAEQRIADLEVALAAASARVPLTTLPEHSAGPGLRVADTWSLAQQEESRARLGA
jgi:hypothetical protein